MLIGLHKDASDLDVAVFGTENCGQVHQALKKLLDLSLCPELCRLDSQGTRDLYRQRVTDTRMAFDEFANAERRKVNQGSFRNRMYYIRFIKDLWETEEKYGFLHYAAVGRVRIEALIADDREAIFTPCTYKLHGVCDAKGTPLPEIKEIVSFRGRFCEQARTGEKIVSEGTLECVRDSEGNIGYRLLLGNFPEDIMVVRN